MKRFVVLTATIVLFTSVAFATTNKPSVPLDHSSTKAPPAGHFACIVPTKARKKSAPAEATSNMPNLAVEGSGLKRILKGTVPVPSAAYNWSLADMRARKDQVAVRLNLTASEQIMGAAVITPLQISVPITLKPETKKVIVRFEKDFKWGPMNMTCDLGPTQTAGKK